MRPLPQLRSPFEPRNIFSLEDALILCDIFLHELQDWTRRAKRGYFQPTHPAQGQGTRQRFAFKDLLVLSIIRLLKIVNFRQHLVSDVIELLNSDSVQQHLAEDPICNFLDELCVSRINPTTSEILNNPEITHFEVRYFLDIGLSGHRDPTEYIQLVRFQRAYRLDPGGFFEELPNNFNSKLLGATPVASKYKSKRMPATSKELVLVGLADRLAFTAKVDLSYIHETIVARFRALQEVRRSGSN